MFASPASDFEKAHRLFPSKSQLDEMIPNENNLKQTMSQLC
jgi:hypothetical protein